VEFAELLREEGPLQNIAARAAVTLGLTVVLAFGYTADLSSAGVQISLGSRSAYATPSQQCQPPLDGQLVYETGVGWWECKCTLNCRWVFITSDPIVVVDGHAIRAGLAYCESQAQIRSIDYEFWVADNAEVSVFELPSAFPEHVTIHRTSAPPDKVKLQIRLNGDGDFNAFIDLSGAIEGARTHVEVQSNKTTTTVLRIP
jgi:hypothetical protein